MRLLRGQAIHFAKILQCFQIVTLPYTQTAAVLIGLPQICIQPDSLSTEMALGTLPEDTSHSARFDLTAPSGIRSLPPSSSHTDKLQLSSR
jgi:hypothetical protein